MYFKFIKVLFLVLILGACKKGFSPVPSKVIKPSKFTDIMVDLRLAESNMKQLNQNHYRYNNLIDSSYQLVYYLHNVTADKYEESLQFYIDHPEWMEKISNEVTEKLNQLTE